MSELTSEGLFIKQNGQIWDLNDLPDGFVIKGDLDLSDKKLEKLPDLSKVTIEGSFDCFDNQLTSLEGAPQNVAGSFGCSGNQLTSLKGAPKEVGGDFHCHRNQLTSLEGAPEKVGGDFSCSDNQLTSLKGAPKEVGGFFGCSDNQLTSLEGAPEKVGGDFSCFYNQLTSLKGAPKEVGGYFSSDVDIAKKYGLGEKFTLDELKASELYIKENKQEMIDKKAQELKYKLLRVAEENVSPEKGVRSDVIKAVMEKMTKNIGK